MNVKDTAEKLLKYHIDLHGNMGKYYAIKTAQQIRDVMDSTYSEHWDEVIKQINKIK